MGRYYWNKKGVVEDYLMLNIFKLNEWGFLSGGSLGGTLTWKRKWSKEDTMSIQARLGGDEKYVALQYTQTDPDETQKAFNYKIELTSTSCNYGGKRYWFVCPLVKEEISCQRMVGKLYKVGDYFGCRHCYNLSYYSRNSDRRVTVTMPDIDRLEKAVKRRYYNGKPTKRYQRLLKAEEKFNQELLVFAKRFEK